MQAKSRIRLALLGCLAAGVVQAAPADELASLLRQSGIRPVEPPSEASDFRLPVLGGGAQRLSDFHGDWVVLTFFATWCRPCVTEMPTLQYLHTQHEGTGLVVLGVSVDSQPSLAERFVAEQGVEFTVFWDEGGVAARDYHASSIPLSYLINPEGRIVGVARGARDWKALDGLLRELMRLEPPGRDAPSHYTEGGGAVELPIKLTPPTATVALSEPRVGVGEPFYLDVRVQWAGNFDEYLLHPPDVSLPEGVEQSGISAETSGAAGRSVVTYRVALAGNEVGAFALDPVELRYTPRFESAPISSRVPGPTVEVEGRFGASFALVGLAAVLALGAAGGWAWRRRSQGDHAPGLDEDPSLERLGKRLEEARRLRMHGEGAECFSELAAVELELLETGEAGDERRREVEAWSERVRFGGEVPSPEELDRLQRRIERRLEELKPDPARARREGLQLRSDSEQAHPQVR